jgi:hypothetical protein
VNKKLFSKGKWIFYHKLGIERGPGIRQTAFKAVSQFYASIQNPYMRSSYINFEFTREISNAKGWTPSF